jgi:hypothetical protein
MHPKQAIGSISGSPSAPAAKQSCFDFLTSRPEAVFSTTVIVEEAILTSRFTKNSPDFKRGRSSCVCEAFGQKKKTRPKSNRGLTD